MISTPQKRHLPTRSTRADISPFEIRQFIFPLRTLGYLQYEGFGAFLLGIQSRINPDTGGDFSLKRS